MAAPGRRPAPGHLHRLVNGVRTHAQTAGLTDLRILFDNIDRTLARRIRKTEDA